MNKQDRADAALDRGVQVGLIAYGLMHVMIAWTALNLVVGKRDTKASNDGALRQFAGDSLGVITLIVMVVGFLCLIVWQMVKAFSPGGEDTSAFERVSAAAKALVYAFLAYTAGRIALGDTKSSGTDSLTAKVMNAPAGQGLVGAIGLAIIGIGIYLIYRGWSEGFTKRLDLEGASSQGTGPDIADAMVWLGKIGYTAKGVSLMAVGGLFIDAAIQHKAKKSGGLDQALNQILDQPFGGPLVLVAAFGFAAYGLYCFAHARYLDR